MPERPVAVVTGGASGFGLALAGQCASAGMDVGLFDRDDARLAEAAAGLVAAHDVRVVSQRVDVGVGAELQSAAALVGAELGRCDLLFSNVGVQHLGAVETVDDEVWRWLLDVNVVGSVRVVRAFLPLLRRTAGARIAFTSSAGALAPAARLGAYQASKAALVSLAETLRFELAGDGIGVTVVYPSGMLTRHLESSAQARPAQLGPAVPGGVAAEDLTAMTASRPRCALDLADPRDAAANAVAGVLAGEPHVITHGDLTAAVAEHVGELETALEQVAVRQPGDRAAWTSAPVTAAGAPTTPTGEQDVDDVQQIQQLKARYFRLLDTKDWAGFRALFTEDVVVDVSEDGAGVFEGLDAFMAMLEPALADVVTVHHGHMPEIVITSPVSATGTWAMEDHLRFPAGSGSGAVEVHGYGHYHDTYVKQDGRWRVKGQKLTRLRLDATS